MTDPGRCAVFDLLWTSLEKVEIPFLGSDSAFLDQHPHREARKAQGLFPAPDLLAAEFLHEKGTEVAQIA
jgi:hypothetical protein